MNDAERTESVPSCPERFSDWVDQERQKDPDNLCDPPIEYDLALHYLFKYLIEDDWYITIPESPKQYTTSSIPRPPYGIYWNGSARSFAGSSKRRNGPPSSVTN